MRSKILNCSFLLKGSPINDVTSGFVMIGPKPVIPNVCSADHWWSANPFKINILSLPEHQIILSGPRTRKVWEPLAYAVNKITCGWVKKNSNKCDVIYRRPLNLID